MIERIPRHEYMNTPLLATKINEVIDHLNSQEKPETRFQKQVGMAKRISRAVEQLTQIQFNISSGQWSYQTIFDSIENIKKTLLSKGGE